MSFPKAETRLVGAYLLSTYEAARYLGISAGTMTNWRNRKEGPPYIKIGTSVRYRLEDLKAWIVARRIEVKEED